jgi:hypothetical protein
MYLTEEIFLQTKLSACHGELGMKTVQDVSKVHDRIVTVCIALDICGKSYDLSVLVKIGSVRLCCPCSLD